MSDQEQPKRDRWTWHKAESSRPGRPAAVYFRDGVDDAFPFDAVLSDASYGEVGIIWNEDYAKEIVATLNGSLPLEVKALVEAVRQWIETHLVVGFSARNIVDKNLEDAWLALDQEQEKPR